MDIGFIGLGNMGSGMAANLVKAGHQVTVYNRSPDKAQALVQQGATAARTVAEASSGAVVFSMLSDDRAVEDVVFGEDGIVTSLAPGATHVSSSTISVALSERLAAAHTQAGQRYAAAPVFGRPEASSAAELFVIAAGAPQVLEPLLPLFDAIGQRTFVVSEQPHAANLVKLSGNFLLASAVETVGEAVALVTKAGVDRQQYVDILTSTLFTAPAYQTYGGLIARQEFEPAGFAATLGLKDLRLVLAAASDLQVPLPVASLLRDRLLTLVATGNGHLDWSAVAMLADRDAGTASTPDSHHPT
ncbi:6-phosphogluconate dehydrogenase [Mycobacterium haemophilum DSM 44634]|uniref:6-phosphogluconate dehydrogenase n=2 Tax=Mycobacterium haemophilum TaxID=29311 RepID=A0A0I9ZSL2_9MYCO|nr:NAD(P)-dependent oxidoreductase [Mycobacterium haemophilum]AKN18476.1 6-phosphogluconate dehydrogenase [Mycobacterium haemophilum DSM 44634]KLO26817.1 6-phosphogluconate dehydrogenase [Mycobacterium haemophilum]KLO38681.1 6-phosphogluconate dehydrogenase [Mycobacterium haemophilum]KLO44998.1 6-phosphogluconate dehydrogenase [Mycobacterium haemophilum]KLO56342.1 6-phosphogluconate dehydrogenase [Mycobacterium haemophilum]